MPVLSNLEKLHTNLIKDGYDLPDLKTFEQDLGDVNKLGKLHTNLIKDGYDLPDIKTFQQDLGVKKKDESNSSLDISAGPYASGQKPSKPKGFGNIVSEKIAKVTPAEQKQAKEQTIVNKKKEAYQKDNSYGQQAMDYLGSGIMSAIDVLAIGGLHAIDVIKPYGEIGEDEHINKAINKIKESNVDASKEAQERDLLQPYNGSPAAAFTAGDWGSVAKLTGLKVLNSIPTSVAIGSNPAVATSWVMGNVSNEYTKLIKEGYTPKQAAIDASINTSTEFVVDRMFGGAKQLKSLFATGGKEAVGQVVKKQLLLELGKSAFENIGGEQVENFISNLSKKYVLGKKNQDLFEGAGDTFWSSLGTSTVYSPLTILNTATNNAIAKEQSNNAELPPNADLMTPERMQQAGVEPQAQDPVIVAIQQNAEDITDNQGNKVQVTDIVPNGVVINNTVIPFNEVFIQGVSLEEIGSVPAEQASTQQEQQPSVTEGVIQQIIDSNTPVTDTEGNLVNLEEALAANVDLNTLLLPSENKTVETVITEAEGIDQQEQAQQSTQPDQDQQPAVPTPIVKEEQTVLPTKIFHATNSQFEGLPSRQEQSKVSTFGTEPAGVFYSGNPDQAKQAIGNGENARLIEADFKPKNPLVIKDINDEVYSNTLNESKQQAIVELGPDYIEAGVDLNTLEEGEIPEAVNKRTSEIFTEKLKEQGFDSVVNNENGDIIVLDTSVVVDSYTVDEADMNNVDDIQTIKAPKEETEINKQIKDLKDQLNSLDAQDDSKLTDKEKKRIKGEDRNTVTSQARGYFLDGGKILWESLKKETGFKGGEFKDFLGIVSNPGKTVDDIANYLWENRDNDKFDTSDYRNAIIDVLNENRAEWLINQRNEVDTSRSQEISETKQRIQEQIDILENADLSFEEIKNEIEANEAMWEQKIVTEGRTKQKSSTFVESDIPIVLEYINKAKELKEGADKSKIQDKIDEIISKDEKLKKVIENLDNILKQLNYTVDC